MRILILLWLCCIVVAAQAQLVDVQELQPDTADRYRFEMRDGSIVYGTITAADRLSITVQTLQLGSVIMQKGSIREVRRIEMDQFHYFLNWAPHPNAMDYFVTPSAHMLEKGRVTYRTMYFAVHTVDVGITDAFSIGGGTEIYSMFDLGEISHVFLRSKAGYRITPKLQVAASGLLVNGPGRYRYWYGPRRGKRVTQGALHGVLTYGSTDSHVSAGGGITFREEGRTGGAFLTLSGSVRLSRKVSMMSESWYIVEEEQMLVSLGMRFHGASLFVDMGAAVDVTTENHHGPVPLPFVALGVLI